MNKENKIKTLLKLFWVFFKIGAFTFGGGYAMIPIIQKEVAEKNKWVTDKEIFDIVTVSESTPGPISINAATFVGYRVAGYLGSAAATFGIVLPSFLIISAIACVLRQFESNEIVKYAFFGIRAGVLALIIKGLRSMYKQCPKDIFSYIIMAVSFAAVIFLNINTVWVIVGSALIGVIYSITARRIEK